MRFCFALIAAALMLAPAAASLASAEPAAGAERFLALRGPNANGRSGPGLEHRIDWIYARQGLPLEVISENGPWKQVRDPDGAQVWMHDSNLEARATAYVLSETTLRREAHANAGARAVLEPGVIGAVTGCTEGWSRIAVGGRVGWVETAALWGADACAPALIAAR